MATVGTIMTITDLSGNTYNIHGMLYGECYTAAETQAKTVAIPGITNLSKGLSIRVRFSYAQSYNGTPTLNVNNLGAKYIRRTSTLDAPRYAWCANEILDLVYDGTYWVIVDGGSASTSCYGTTLLATSATSTNEATALTPASLNSTVANMIANYPIYSTSGTYAVGDRVRYSFNLYECNTAITTAEGWTAAHWTKLPTLVDEVKEVYDELESRLFTTNSPIEIPANSNLNDYRTNGVYFIPSTAVAETISNIPDAQSGRLIVFSCPDRGSSDFNYGFQIYFQQHSGAIYTRNRRGYEPYWNDWTYINNPADMIKRVNVSKSVSMSAMGEIKFCNYSDIASDCSYNKIIGITPQNIQTGANTVIDVLVYSDGIYIDSVAAFANKKINLLVTYATVELPMATKNL